MWWPDDNINIPQAGGQTMTVSLVVLANKKASTSTSVVIPTQKPKDISPLKKTVPTVAKHQRTVSSKPIRQQPQPPATHSKITKAADTSTQPPTKNIAHLDSVAKTESRLAATENTEKQLQSVLRQAFNTHFYYPRMAIRRGWSGEVHLSLRIESNGTLSHVRILKGSGFDLLDEAAVNSLDKVEVLPSATALLDGNSLDLILPVEYRLL